MNDIKTAVEAFEKWAKANTDKNAPIPADLKDVLMTALWSGWQGAWKTDIWVPIDSGFPDFNCQCLVYGPHGIEAACWNHEDHCWDTADGDDFWKKAGGWFTHWRLFPEAPNE